MRKEESVSIPISLGNGGRGQEEEKNKKGNKKGNKKKKNSEKPMDVTEEGGREIPFFQTNPFSIVRDGVVTFAADLSMSSHGNDRYEHDCLQ